MAGRRQGSPGGGRATTRQRRTGKGSPSNVPDARPHVNQASVPKELRDLQRWVCWKVVKRDGKPTKVPYIAEAGLQRRAAADDPDTWRSFGAALKLARRCAGIGVMLGDGLAGVDLDKCRDPHTGEIEPWAREIITALGSYTEVSPSGTGVHVLVWGEKPGGRCRSGGVEIYDSGRYFCVTGDHVAGTPETVEQRGEELAAVHLRYLVDGPIVRDIEGSRDPKLRALWAGDWTGSHKSQSEADLELLRHLQRLTRGDRDQMDRLFRRSGLYREKWERTDYRERTLSAAEAGSGTSATGKRGDVSPADLAEAILEDHHYARDRGGRLYAYVDGVYVPEGETHIAQQAKVALVRRGQERQWTSYRVREATAYIASDAPYLLDVPPLDTVNLTNGLLDVKTRTLRAHTPEFRSPVRLPVAYDPDADCPAWEAFIGQVFPKDSREVPWELAAWLMLPYISVQKAVLLLGSGANGKSAFLAGLTAFIGVENCAAVSLHKLEENRFSVARLVGKLANICPDLPTEHLRDTSVLKALTGAEYMVNAEYKHGANFEFKCYARLVFSANDAPRSKDTSEAFFRRWLVIPFTRTFEGVKAERRDDIDRRLADPHELSGVLNRALDAWPRVYAHGLTETGSMTRAAFEFRTATDPIAAWLEENTEDNPEAQVGKRELRDAYSAHCQQTGLQAPTDSAFGTAVKRLRPSVTDAQVRVDGRRKRVWRGIEVV